MKFALALLILAACAKKEEVPTFDTTSASTFVVTQKIAPDTLVSEQGKCKVTEYNYEKTSVGDTVHLACGNSPERK